MAVLGIAAGASLASAAAEPRTWTASGSGAAAIVTDCRNCGDDVGMLIACKGAGQPAEVTVMWAAVENGVEGARAPVVIGIDGKSWTYQARTLHYGAIGYPPAFMLSPGDPLVDALQSGQQANVRFGAVSTTISLAGAAGAIDTFKRSCGWSAVAAPAPDEAKVAAAPPSTLPELRDENGATWSFARRGAAAVAVFGIPQTDATSVTVSCESGTAPLIEFFSAPTRNRGTRATLTLVSGELAFALPAQANENGRLQATLDGPAGAFRHAMMGSEWVQAELSGQSAGRFLGFASSAPGRKFLQACPQFGE